MRRKIGGLYLVGVSGLSGKVLCKLHWIEVILQNNILQCSINLIVLFANTTHRCQHKPCSDILP